MIEPRVSRVATRLQPRTVLLVSLLTLGGCTALHHVPPPVGDSTPVAPPVETLPRGEAPVAILVSRDLPLYTSVAEELSGRLRVRHRTYSLEGSEPSAIARQIQTNGERIVVAIGPGALRAAQSIAGVDVVYAQVASPSIVATEFFRGVDAIPPFTLQLSQWLQISPGLNAIGVVASANMRTHVARLRSAAASTGVTLISHEVSSDKEALLRFRQMLPQIDGYILLPDEGVLSPTVIQQMLSHSRQHHKQVVVYSEVLFALGAFMLVSPLPDDIADQLMTLIAQPSKRTARLMPLTAMTTVVRPTASR